MLQLTSVDEEAEVLEDRAGISEEVEEDWSGEAEVLEERAGKAELEVEEDWSGELEADSIEPVAEYSEIFKQLGCANEKEVYAKVDFFTRLMENSAAADALSKKIPARGDGTSKTSNIYRKEAERKAASAGCRRITDFLTPQISPVSASSEELIDESLANLCLPPRLPPSTIVNGLFEENSDDDDDEFVPDLSVDECIALIKSKKLASISSNKKHDGGSSYDHLRYLCILQYFKERKAGLKKIASSKAACHFFYERPVEYLSRCIRIWAEYFAEFKSLPTHQQGCHAKIISPISDETVLMECKQLFRSIKRNDRTAEEFANKYQEHYGMKIAVRTAARWLPIMGFKQEDIKSQVYKDGHEEPNTILKRSKFVSTFLGSYYPYLTTYQGSEMEVEVAPAVALPASFTDIGIRKIIWVFFGVSISFELVL